MDSEDFAISPRLAIVIILIILGMVLLVTFLVNPSTYREGRLGVFFATLAGFTIFVLFFYYYMLVSVNAKSQLLLINQETYRVNDLTIATLSNNMTRVASFNPEYVKQLNPLMPCPGENCETGNNPKSLTMEQCYAQSSLSYDIFIIWQATVASEDYSINPLPYITRYLQFANSKILFGYWGQYRIDFGSKIQVLGDLLFEYGLPIERQKPSVYQRQAQLLVADPRFSQIF